MEGKRFSQKAAAQGGCVMGFISDLIGKFIPGPFYTDYTGDYPEDRWENEDSHANDPAPEPEQNEPTAGTGVGTGAEAEPKRECGRCSFYSSLNNLQNNKSYA
jgi:hypothetical protein